MSQQGRFGKYGEVKRFDRLRKAGMRTVFNTLQARRPLQRFHAETAFGQGRLQAAQIKIRPAKPADIDFISDLSDRVFAVYGPYREIIISWFGSETTATFIAKIQKKPVAFGMLGFLSDENYQKRLAELLAMAVAPEWQKQGIGRKILEVIENKAKELHIKQLSLHTARENQAAQKLFTQKGFIMVGLKDHYYPAGQTSLMMIKEFI